MSTLIRTFAPTRLRSAARRRRGSILILVVALVVLLALMGTAYLSSTQVERYTSAQNTINTEGDLALPSLLTLTQNAIVNDLYNPATGQFRPTVTATATAPATPPLDLGDTTGEQVQPWLASRLPTLRDNAPTGAPYGGDAGNNGAVGANLIGWDAVSWPLLATNQTYQFADPLRTGESDDAVSLPAASTPNTPVGQSPPPLSTPYQAGATYALGQVVSDGLIPPTFYVSLTAGNTGSPLTTAANWKPVAPKSVRRYEPTSVAYNGVNYPALRIYNRYNTVAPVEATILAADADGDGIADAGLFRLPGGPVNGITYYGATRVVDNAAALNVNTAFTNVTDYKSDGTATTVDSVGNSASPSVSAPVENLGVFPAHVGLMQLLPDYVSATLSSPDMTRALDYLRNGYTGIPGTDLNTSTADAYIDFATAKRTDFSFTTVGEQLASQLARRVGHPGQYAPYSAAGGSAYQPFSLSDSAALASRFCLKSDRGSFSPIEYQLRDSTYLDPLISSTPYDPSTQVAAWFEGNFCPMANKPTTFTYPAGVVGPAARAMVVASNPVSDLIRVHSVQAVPFGALLTATTVTSPVNPGMLPYAIPAAYDYAKTYVVGQYVTFVSPPTAPTAGQTLCYVALTAVPSGASPGTPPVNASGVLDTADWRPEPFTAASTKANVNTATFAALWRAFYNVMADGGDTVPPQYGTSTAIPAINPGWGPFRNPTRNLISTNILTSSQTMQLRAALAAVNAMDMRDNDDEVTSRRFKLYTDASHATPAFDVTVFGAERQLFITTAVADYDGTNPTGVSIEFYNPTDLPIDISNWQVGAITRTATTAPGPPPTTTGTTTIGPGGNTLAAGTIPLATTPIPPKGYVILTSYPTGSGNFTAPATEPQIQILGLEKAANPATPLEIVLLRPRKATYSPPSTTFDNAYNEGTAASPNLDDLVPVDMIDFTGVFTAGAAGQRIYERPHGQPVSTASGYNWQFVYPGAYTPEATTSVGPPTTPAQSGWGTPLVAKPAVGAFSDGTTNGGTNPVVFPPLQLANANTTGTVTNTWVGPSAANALTSNKYPFGSFMRNGDMLKIPFIGAYTIHPVPLGVTVGNITPIVAMNSITLDASQADAGIPVAGVSPMPSRADEPIGHFIPLSAINPTNTGYTSAATPNPDPYGWASHFFDYLDVQVADDDYLPNVDPRLADGSLPTATNVASATNPQKYPNNVGATAALEPVAVANTPGAANGTAEQSVGKQGLININTASSYILQQLPGVSPAMANTIFAYRQTNGPFKSIFELNRVGAGVAPVTNEFQSRGGFLKFTKTVGAGPAVPDDDLVTNDPGLIEGDFTQDASGTNDGVRDDFEERTLMLSRISNLITTRSDSFTCYVLVQGWRGVGTGTPTLAVQRRAAFILDRTAATATNRQLTRLTVPTN